MSHWLYKNQPVFDLPEGVFGFVYRITSLIDGRKYIGRKYVTKAAKRSVKLKNGTKKIRKTMVESDWKTYMGSCKPLLEDISKNEKNNYKFEILSWGFTKGQVNSLEIICQIKAGVMTDDSYYNDAVGSGMFRGVKFTDEFRKIISEIDL